METILLYTTLHGMLEVVESTWREALCASMDIILLNIIPADSSGGGLAGFVSKMEPSGSSVFTHNSATEGGGILAKNRLSAVNIVGICTFNYNSAQDKGGGIYVGDTSILRIDGESHFKGNSASYFGGGVASLLSTATIVGKSYFTNNCGKYGGSVYAEKSNSSWKVIAIFSANSATRAHDGYSDGNGGAIHARSSNLIFNGSLEFTSRIGGAIALSGLDHDQNMMLLLSNTKITLKGNFVLHRGGAVHVEDNPLTYCIFESKLQSSLREACMDL